MLLKSIALLAGCASLETTCFANVVYDNLDAAGPNGRSFRPDPESFAELGDQVFFLGTDRWITDFSFDCFLSTRASGDETGQLFLYLNDGGQSQNPPETVIYQSRAFRLNSGFQRVAIRGLAVNVPHTFTWAINFSGINQDEAAGLVLHNPPTVGANVNEFSLKNKSGAWKSSVIDGGDTPENFAARITAVSEQPSADRSGLGQIDISLVPPPEDEIFGGDWYDVDQQTAKGTPGTSEIANLTIDPEGKIQITLADGTQFVRGQILLQDFETPGALIAEGANIYSGLSWQVH